MTADGAWKSNRHCGLEDLLGIDMANACDYARVDAHGKSFIQVFDELALADPSWRDGLERLILTRETFAIAAGVASAATRRRDRGVRG